MPGGDAWARKDPAFNRDFGPEAMDTPARVHSVYLTQQLIVALWFADMAAMENGSKPAILEVKLPADLAYKLVHDEEGSRSDPSFSMRFEGTIPPEFVSVLPEKVLKTIPKLGAEHEA
jgi:hypothetical protein